MQDNNIIQNTIDYIKKLNKKNTELKAENARLKSCLQEIKAIAERPNPYIDNSVTKTATEVEYDYAAICNKLELRLHKVLELITKAEEE